MKEYISNARRFLSLIAITSLMVVMAGVAVSNAAESKDEKKLTVGITMLNSDAKLPQGEKVVTKQLTDEFGVKSDKITSLKGKNLGYGEIAAVLALADKMDGGVTDANINKVMTMKPGGTTGWSQIAKSLNVDIADIAGKVSDLEDSAHSNIKEAALKAPESGRGAGGGATKSDSGAGRSGESGSGSGSY
jgi:hypothetical protein